jgi:hypothetical protein
MFGGRTQVQTVQSRKHASICQDDDGKSIKETNYLRFMGGNGYCSSLFIELNNYLDTDVQLKWLGNYIWSSV